VSQLPVVKDKHIVGILDESDILATVEGDDAARAARFRDPVHSAMTTELHTVQVSEKLKVLAPTGLTSDERTLMEQLAQKRQARGVPDPRADLMRS